MWALITAWLGPLLVLSALSVLLSVLLRSSAGIVVALLLWALRVMTLAHSQLAVLTAVTGWLWSTSPATAVVAAASLAIAVIAIGRKEDHYAQHPLGA